MRGVTFWKMPTATWSQISTHTPHARRDMIIKLIAQETREFQLTRLMRGVTAFIVGDKRRLLRFQLTRLMRGVTDFTVVFNALADISTHTPHARRDELNEPFCIAAVEFQLTRLMRGVT